MNRKILGALLVTLICIFSLFAPYFSQKTYFEIATHQANLPPSSAHFFGTDDLGRDLFIRVAYGIRVSLFVGIAAALLDLAIGVLFGGISALYGGKVDLVMMRLADILYAIPSLLMVILLTVIFTPSLMTLILAIALTGWVTMARIVRGSIAVIKQEEYVLASLAFGASKRHLLWTHLIPNAKGPIVTTLFLTIPSAIFQEAFLSFLGLGIQAPMASLGTLASDALPALAYYPWQLFFPAAGISLTLLSFYLIGNPLGTYSRSALSR